MLCISLQPLNVAENSCLRQHVILMLYSRNHTDTPFNLQNNDANFDQQKLFPNSFQHHSGAAILLKLRKENRNGKCALYSLDHCYRRLLVSCCLSNQQRAQVLTSRADQRMHSASGACA